MRHRSKCFLFAAAAIAGLGLAAAPSGAASQTLRTFEEFQPKVKWGGRAIAIAQSGAINRRAIVASATGGLFITKDGGTSWSHLDGLPPFRMSDVKYAPLSAQIVIATSLADSRVVNRGGIWRSADGGDHWIRPATVDPQTGPGCPDRVSAYGISFQLGSNNVYVGTTCGLAISRDLGATWEHTVPNPGKPLVSSVVATRSGHVLICGEGGVFLRAPGAVGWTKVLSNIGGCDSDSVHAVDFSEDARTFFVTTGTGVLQKSDDMGVIWSAVANTPSVGSAPRRAVWVRVSPPAPSGSSADLYYGDGVNVSRITCQKTNPGLLCNGPWSGGLPTGHFDPNDISFLSDNCPNLVVTDGGVQRAADLDVNSPGAPRAADCGDKWVNVGNGAAGFNALQIYHVAGQIFADHTDLYFGTQDNGLWASGNNGLSWPPDPFDQEGYGFQLERWPPDQNGIVVAWMQTGDVFSRARLLLGPPLPWTNPPGSSGKPQCVPIMVSRGVYFQFSNVPNTPSNALFVTQDGGASWQLIVTIPDTIAGCLQVSGPPANPTVYQVVQTPGSLGRDPRYRLLRVSNTLSGTPAVWRSGAGLSSVGTYSAVWMSPFVAFAVNPTDPNHLIVSDVGTNEMKSTRDGGLTWLVDAALTQLVTTPNTAAPNQPRFVLPGSQFLFSVAGGGEGVKNQVHAIAFNPDDSSHIVVGTEAAGVIETFDRGATWRFIDYSDRITAITSFFFDRNYNVIVSTWGRGLWKVVSRKVYPPHVCVIFPDACYHDVIDTLGERFPRYACPHWPDLPTCQILVAMDGRVRGFELDSKDDLRKLFFDGEKIAAFDGLGADEPLRAPIEKRKTDAGFPKCPACASTIKNGGVIKAVILGKSRILGIVAEFPDKRPAKLPDVVAKSQAADENAPLLQLVGEFFASGRAATPSGEKMVVYGKGFCREPPCSGVKLSLGNAVVSDNVKSESDGTFKATFVVKERPGRYLLRATQNGPGGKLYEGLADVFVPIIEGEDEKKK